MTTYDFSARSYDWRLHCGEEAIENRLKEEVIRLGAERAFAICSPSIKNRTRTMERIKVFNANAGMRNPEQQCQASFDLLEAAW